MRELTLTLGGSMGSRGLFRFLTIAVVLLPALAVAQGTGTIRGRTTDAGTGAPLPNVQIRIDGTTLGGQSGSNGEYAIAGVPSGSQSISARRVGYAPQQVTVVVAGAGEITQNFAMRAAAVTLSEVVVTGVGAPTTKRQLGNTIETVSGEQVARAPGVTSIDQALQGRVTGAVISENSGQPGGGISIRLRGTNSILGGAEPLYVVDGVLVDNSSEALVSLSGNAPRGNQALSNRMADFDPADVERIEVLKGAAAAALYGARANNGVIQIFTRRGQSGAPRVNVSTDLAWSKTPNRYELNMHPNAGFTDVVFGDARPDGTRPVLGEPIQRYDIQDQVFRTALNTNTRMSVSGGNASGTNYYMGGGYQQEEGIIRSSDYERLNFRVNVSQRVSSRLDIGVRGNYIKSTANFVPEGEQTQGVLTSIIFTPTSVNPAFNPTLGRFPYNPVIQGNPLDVIENWEAPENVTRMLGGVEATWRPVSSITIRYLAGLDDYRREVRYFQPPFSINAAFTGSVQNPVQFSRLFNNDFTATHVWAARPSLELNTSAGFRYTSDETETIRAAGSTLAGGQNLVGGATQTATQSKSEFRTVGGYIEERASIADRLFLTGGLNWDASSAFGADERVQMFPRLGISYVLDRESWWRERMGNFLSAFRLRAAYGQTGGQPPGLYSRFENSDFTPFSGKIGIVSSSTLANAGLKPERQREIEGGFDAGFWNDRAQIEFSYYDKQTKDLVLSIPLAPSSGFANQFQNIGSLRNKGIEVALNTVNMSGPNFGWRSRFTYSANRNKVEKLVSATDTLLGDNYLNAVIVGQPIGIFYGGTYARTAEGQIAYRPVTVGGQSLNLPYRETVVLNGRTVNASRIIGDPNPDFVATLGNEFDIGERVQFSVLLDGRFGNDVANFTRRITELFGVAKVTEREITGDTVFRTFSLNPAGRSLIYEEYIEDGSYVKLREIAVQLKLGPALVRRLGAQDAMLRIAGRNLVTWTDYTGLDPEVNLFSASTVQRGVDFATTPLPRQFSIGLSLNF
ncbi:MAG: SusC/RagA family TonB-linked outer membrane protein [Gemmatimonadota bacterium]|nr:SusC/RagA family TonB-linked outer membrane protein [Gemmatimonadota bacterium]